MTLNSPRFSEATKIEDDPKYEKYIKIVYIDKTKLSEKAMQICKELHINPDDMIDKSLEVFIKNGKDLREIAELRYNHYQNKRRKYFEQIIKVIGPISKKKKKNPYLNASMFNINTNILPLTTMYQNNNSLFPQITKTDNKLQILNLQQPLTGNNSPIRKNRNNGISTGLAQQLYPLSPQKTEIEIKKPITVGKAQFRPAQAQSQDYRQLSNNHSQNYSNMNGFVTQGRSDSPDLISAGYQLPMSTRSVDKQSYHVKLAQKLIQKEQDRVEKLRRTRLNAILLAEQEVQKHEMKIQNKHSKFSMFQENMKRKQSEDQRKLQQVQQKRSHARQYFSQTIKDIENKAQSIYDIRLQEISQMTHNRSIREKQMSSSQYMKFQSKYQEELLQNSKKSELKKREDEETSQYLNMLESKIDSGSKKAQNYLQQNIANYTNKFESNLQEAYKTYKHLSEQQFNTSVDKVRLKDYMIEAKLKKKFEDEQKRRNQIRTIISQKFDRNKIQRKDLSQQMSNRAKATLDRIDHKFKVHESIFEQKEIEHMKRKEINSLRLLDQRENYLKSKEQTLIDKSKVMNKMSRIDETKRQAEEIKRNILDKMKVNTLQQERDVMQNLKPKEVLLKAKLNLTLQATLNSPTNRLKKRNLFSNSLPGFNSTKSARLNISQEIS